MAPSSRDLASFRSTKTEKETVGSMRYIADKRQIAGLLMVTSFCAVIMPLYSIASAIEPNGKTVVTGLEFASLIGSNVVAATGFVSVLVGYMETVHDTGHKYATIGAILLSQAVWLAYLSSMVGIGQAASTGNAFIPQGYSFGGDDVWFVGAMGILGIAAYGFSLVGAVAFFQFALLAFQNGKPDHRNAPYFQSRQRFYSIVLYVAGVGQLALGVYTYLRFGDGLIDKHGPIVVGFYVISYPTLAIFAGFVQLLLGTWGFARTFGYFLTKDKEWYFTFGMGLGWFLQLGLQILAQIGVTPGSDMAGLAATVASFGFGLFLMPAYLDYKTRHTPADIYPEYYGLEVPEEAAPSSISERFRDEDLESPRRESAKTPSMRTPSTRSPKSGSTRSLGESASGSAWSRSEK